MTRRLAALALMLALALATAATADARLAVQPKRLNFGDIVFGQGSAPQPVFYTNTGSTTVLLTLPTFPDPAWFGSPTLADQPGLAGCGILFLASDETCTMGYLFNPQGIGRDSTPVTMGYQEFPAGRSGSATVRLVGTGVSGL